MSNVQNLVEVTDDLKRKVKSLYGKSDEDIKQDLEIIYEWWQKQPHLPQIKDDGNLERMMMRNKFRVEQTKKKLDAYFTLKGLYSDFFYPNDLDPGSECFKNCLKVSHFLPMKTPMESGERVMFFCIKDPSYSEFFNLGHLFTYTFTIFEILNQFDYCSALRIVVDMENFKLPFYTKVDPILLVKGMKLWQEGFSCRLASIEYINAPSFMDLMVKLVSTVIKGNKIHVNDSLEKLYETVPQKYLPDEYGGEAGKLQDIQDDWIREITHQKDFIAKRAQLVSNENLRIGEAYGNNLFGSEGTFKKLNLD